MQFTGKRRRLFASMLCLVLLCCLSTSIEAHNRTEQSKSLDIKTLQTGDLLFEIEDDGSSFSNAITSVTKGESGMKISHVAIFDKPDSKHYRIIDATPSKGVAVSEVFQTENDSDKETQSCLFFVGRTKKSGIGHRAISRALKYVGRKYDKFFIPNDSTIYCSELVQLSYLKKDGTPLFPSVPMSFHDDSGTILPYWTQYYQQYGMEVPEGEPGTNPGDMSMSKDIYIIGIIHINVSKKINQ